MNEQLTFNDLLGISNPYKITTPKQINYATPCGGCLCSSCANNVDCMAALTEEQDKACFNCDECFYYTGEIGALHNKKTVCMDYKITNDDARKARELIRKNNSRRWLIEKKT